MADPRTVAPSRPAMSGASQPDIYDLLAEEQQPRSGWVRGITSMTPPTVQCEKCSATSSHERSLLLAIRRGGFAFNPRRPDDPRRLCGTCAWDEWPEERTGDYGTPVPRPEPMRTAHSARTEASA